MKYNNDNNNKDRYIKLRAKEKYGFGNTTRKRENEKEHNIIYQTDASVCACVFYTNGGSGGETAQRRSLSKQQRARGHASRRCWRWQRRRDWIPEGRVINPRAKYAKIPAGKFITRQWRRRRRLQGEEVFVAYPVCMLVPPPVFPPPYSCTRKNIRARVHVHTHTHTS